MTGRLWRRTFGDAGRGLAAFVLVFLIGCFATPKAPGSPLPVFLAGRTQIDILFEYCEYGLLAVGMTVVILLGGIDLSVGSVLGLSATLFALLTVGFGWEIAPALLATLAVGTAVGALNGWLVTRFRLQPFVATLAMMTAARGAAKWICGGIKVAPAAQPWYKLTQNTPAFFTQMTQSLPGIGLQPASLVFLACLLAVALLLSRTVFGRNLYAIGGNEEAARLAGLPVERVKVASFALCAALAALAGIVNACRQDLGDPESGFGYELDAIAAVVIGGTTLAGGRGNMLWTLLGVLIVAYINKILSLNGLPLERRMIVQAAIIVVAVLVQRKESSA